MELPDPRLLKLANLLKNLEVKPVNSLLGVIQKLEFLKASAQTYNIPQLPQTLSEIIKDIEPFLNEQKAEWELVEPVSFLFIKKILRLKVEVTFFVDKPPRFKILHFKFK